MTTPEPDLREDMDAMLRAAGIAVTEEGKVAARLRRLDAVTRWTPEKRAALRAQLGLPADVA